MIVLIWIGFGVVTAVAANSRGRNKWAWTAWGVLCGPFALAYVLVAKPVTGKSALN